MQLNELNFKVKPPKIKELLDKNNSVLMATLNEDGTPHVSYAPYANLEGGFQVFVSFMSKHTKNLLDREKVSVMVIEDESTTKQIYARERLTMDCEARRVEKEDPFYAKSIEALSRKHGKVVGVLEDLNDFVLFDLHVNGGNYVNGFASAYEVNADFSVANQIHGAHGQNAEEQ